MEKRLRGRIALLKGGACGIGRAVVVRLIEAMATVVIIELRFNPAHQAIGETCAAVGQTSASGGDGAQGQARHFDIMVNKAMCMGYDSVCYHAPETLQRKIETDFHSVACGSQAEVKRMEFERSIVNIVSAAGFNGSLSDPFQCRNRCWAQYVRRRMDSGRIAFA